MATTEKPKISSERKKLYALGGLVGLLVILVGGNVLFSGKKPVAAPPPPTTNDGRIRNSDIGKSQANTSATPGGAVTPGPNDQVFGPIEVLPVAYAGGGDVQVVRNIFDYPPPPIEKPKPLPPPVRPPPPTINLGSVSPSNAIAGTSKPITITLLGSLFPADAEVLFGGQPIPTQRVSGTVVKATIPPSALGQAGARTVEVKSASQRAELWSTKLNFQLAASPEPATTFVFSGRIGPQAVITFKDATKKPQLVSIGGTINGEVPWKVLSINDKAIELLDTRNEIRKSLGLVAKNR